jgi:oligopeptidase B
VGAAKSAANLRELKTGDNLLLLKAEFDSGYYGPSGRFDSHKDIVMEYAFLIDRLGAQ